MRYQQPQGPIAVDRFNPITRGLSLLENLSDRSKAVIGGENTLFGTYEAVGRGGVGASFGASDSIACPIVADSVKRTILAVTVAKGSGAGGNLGRIFDTRASGLLGYSAWRDDSAGQESFNRGWSGANGQWYWAAGPAGQVSNLAIAYDGSSLSNVPTVIRNGVAQAISVNTNPAGSLNTVTDSFYIGNRKSDNARNWSGEIYLLAVWDRILNNDELISVSRNPWKIFRKPSGALFVYTASSSLAAAASGAAQAGGAAMLASAVALASVGVSLATGSATPAVSVPLSAAGIDTTAGNAGAVATVSLSAAALAQAAGQAGLSASVLLAAAGAAQAAGNAALAAQLNALAAGSTQASGTASGTVSVPGSLSANGQDVASGSAVLSVRINLAATGADQSSGTAAGTATAPGTLSANGQDVASGAAALSAGVKLAATGADQASGTATGTATAPGNLAASGADVASGWANLSTLVTLTAAGFVQAMGAGQFAVTIPLAASGASRASGSAGATVHGLVHNFRLAGSVRRLTSLVKADRPARHVKLSVVRKTTLLHEVRHA